jgi:hypothetical protein
MNVDLLKYLSKQVQEEVEVIQKDLSLGKASDYGDYKFSCGMVRGLLIANNILMETSERMRENDE